MDCNELIILDVGHGNCAIVRKNDEAIIIDAPSRPVVARILEELGIKSIFALLISHADADHLSGAIPILMNEDRPVKHVYINPDARNSEAWRQFRIAAGDARKKRDTEVHASLNIKEPHELCLADTFIRVLHPTPEMCLATNEGTHTDGVRLDANSMSAVILIEHAGERVCLLAADSGRHSLDSMLSEQVDISAKMLVFPHHGGNNGSLDNRKFAKDLVSSVQPKLVMFSLGRGMHGTPRPEIIAGTREANNPEPPYIACTQMSKNCANAVPRVNNRVINKYSDGLRKDQCCAGTVVIPLRKDGVISMLDELSRSHGKFVSDEVPQALCMRKMVN